MGEGAQDIDLAILTALLKGQDLSMFYVFVLLIGITFLGLMGILMMTCTNEGIINEL